MSDLFEREEQQNFFQKRLPERPEQLAGKNANLAAELAEQRAAHVADIRKRNERAQKLREQYGFDYSVNQYAALAGAIDNGIIGEDQAYDILASQLLSDNLARQGVNINPLEIYENLPAYSRHVLGRPEGQSPRTPQGNLAAIYGQLVIGGAGMMKNFWGMYLADARNQNDAELERLILERLKLEDETIEEYGDYQKRNFLVEAAKFAAQSVPYTAFVMAGGLLAGAPGAFAAGMVGATGQAYLGLDAAGVDHKIAYPISIAMGAVNALIEIQLGNAAGLISRATGANTLQSAISKRAAAFVSDKLHLSGVALKMATGPIANYTLEILGETSEEIFQEIGDIVFTELAAFLQGEGVELGREDYIRRIAENAKGGFMASLIMGIPGLSIGTVGSISDYRALRTDADTIPSEQLFKERHKDSPLRGEMTDEEWDKELSKIHEGRQSIREREESRIAEELRATAGLGTGYAEQKYDKEGNPIPLGETYRRRNGLLYTELDERRRLFKIGDPRVEGTRNLYAHIGYKLDEDGTVHVNEFRVRNDLDTAEFRQETFTRFAEAFAGHEIVWDAKTTREAEIREGLIKGNPYGEKAGLNYYSQEDTGRVSEARYRNQVIDNFKRYFPQLGNAEHAVMAAEWEFFAELRGQSLEEYVTREFGSLEKAFTVDPNRRIDAAMKAGEKVQGAVTFESEARDAKAIIYLSKNADLTTFIHEMGHIYRRRLSGEMLAEAERLWGVENHKWTTEQEERFTEDFERWRREGKAPTPEMQSFFEKFAEFLKKLINAISLREEVSPEIKEFFDTLYTGEKASQGARTSQEGRETAQTGNDTAAGPEGAQKASTAQYEANKKFNEERPLLDKNNEANAPRPKQPSNNIDEVYRLVEEAREEFDKYVEELQQKYGGEIKSRKELKDRGRAERKIKPDNGADNILDINGKTLILDDLQTIVSVMQDLHGRNEVVRMKDRYKVPPESHYRDTLINIRMSNGAVVELQLNMPQMVYAKDNMYGHTVYEISDEIEKGWINNAIALEEYSKIYALCVETQVMLYDAAFSASLASAIFNESSLDMGEPLLKISDIVGQSNDGFNVLSEKTRKAIYVWRENANGISSTSQNSSEGSSKSGTSTAGLEDVTLSTVAAEAGTTESSNISVPSTNSIANKKDSVNRKSEKNSAENEKRIEKAKAKWEAADRVKGAEDQITLQTGEEIKGHYELGEAGISTPSVDPDADFTKSEGFPVNDNGTSMNVGRDYTGGFSQDAALRMADGFDQRGTGIIVDSNGVTSSGNNRDISRRIAAKNGTDGKYINYLKSYPERLGFTKADIAKYKHPTLYFVVNAPAAYSPLYFDQFNRSGKKSTSPIETAIKMSYLVKGDMVKEFSRAIGNYDSINELYEDTQAATEIFKSLMKRGIISENSYPDYVETVSIKGKQHERITSNGKEFLESVMLGAVLNEDSIRTLSLVPEIRKRVVKGLSALVDNAALGEYCVVSEINQAIAIAVEIQTNKKKYKSISDYADQTEMDLGQRISTDIEVELAGRLLEKTEYAFSDMMGGLNAVLQEEARGQSDMFGGTSKDDILRRYLGVKARADSIREANNKVIESETAAGLEKVQAVMENAGLARSEADGTFFQAAYQGSPYLFNRYNNSYVGSGLGKLRYGWGHTFYSQKEAAEWFRQAISKYKGAEAELYEVDIPDDHNLLHWEKPMSEQAEAVQRAADKLITWNKNGVSHFNEAFNLRKFNDGSYGFNRSINGKMKWPTIKEAQAAARGEIKKTLTGEEFYNALSDRIGAKRTSLLLDHLGIKGTKYLDKSIEKAGLKKGYNYVIYGDSDIQITGAPRAESRALVPYGTLFQTAYHGSPNRFERFDSSHMGEGEGTQIKGYGHYCASKKEVAEWYRIILNFKPGAEIYVDGVKAHIIEDYELNEDLYFNAYYAALTGQLDNRIQDFEKQFAAAVQEDDLNEMQRWGWALERAKELKGKKVELKSGQLYEVDIPEDDEMLDWDKSLDEQPEKVKNALGNIVFLLNEERGPGSKNPDLQFYGSSIYGYISEARGSDQAASQYLNSIGIKGIRYLDGDSRAAGEGTHNYVIFNDSDINITQTFFQKAYHGSPYRFDRFDNSHMSSGEGNQTFGWGHYFAGSKEVAEYYRETLSSRTGQFEEMDDKKFSGRTMAEWYKYWERGVFNKKPTEARPLFDRMAMIENLMVNYDYKNTLKEARENEYAPEAIEWFERTFEKDFKTPGQLYEVDIPGDEDMLDWDKPLSEQPEKIKKIKDQLITWEYDNENNTWKLPFAHAKITIFKFEDGYGFKGDMNKRRYNSLEEAKEELINYFYSKGSEIYNLLTHRFGSKKAASQYLNSLGIKGILYLDGDSRAAGEGSHNYVIFDDSDINITQTFFQTVEQKTKTDEFKNWFGDWENDPENASKVVDENGKPLMVFRGDKAGKDRFTNRQGIYFAVDRAVAEKYASGGLYDLFLNIRNPLNMNEKTFYEVRERINEMLEEIYEQDWSELEHNEQFQTLRENYLAFRNEEGSAVRDFYNEFLPEVSEDTDLDDLKDILLKSVHDANTFEWRQIDYRDIDILNPFIKALGYDGIIRPYDPLGQMKGNEYVIFEPNQVKSATDNAGTFDPQNNSIFFQLEDELIEDAAQYDSWREFRESIEEGEASDADNAWYRSLWNDARKIYKDTLFQEEEKTDRAGELDRRFYSEADRKYLTEALKELYRIHNDQSLKPDKEEDGEVGEEYRRVKRLQQRIQTELPNAGSIIGMAAQVRSGRELSSTQYDRLKGWIRKNTRDYRAVFADIMGQEEYLEDLAGTKDGEPAGRLANPHRDKFNIKERLKEIAKIMREADPALAKEIEDGTVSYDDPRIAAFEAGVETEYAEAKAALEALEKETAEDYARLANDAQRRIVNIHKKMIEAREQLESTNEKLRQMMDEEGKIAEPYLKRQKLEQANYDQALKAYNDLVDLHGKDVEVREAVARREAHASERVRQTGIRRRQRALRELKEIKKKLIKRVTRKVSFDTVAYEQAETVKAIQRISEAFIFEGINKWIGPKGREILRGVWSQWSTDEEFRDTLIEQVLKRKHGDIDAERIKNILGKDWGKITVVEKKKLHKLLPKTDFIKDLKLKELARENRESIQLDIDENYIDGRVQLIIGEDLKRRLKETLGDELYSRILNKPLAEWSITEAEELARIIDRLTVEGMRDLAAKKEARRVLEQEYRDKVLEALEKTGVVINPDDTPEEKERKEKEKNRILKKFAGGKRNNIFNNFFDANLRRFTTAMDGGRKGIFTSLLYWSENDAYNEEQRQIAARRIVIDKVMKDNNITIDELYREVKIPALEGLDIDLYEVSGGKVTVDDLLYIMRGYQNEETRNAIMYGNLSNASEREHSIERIEDFANIAHGRMMAVISFAKQFFAQEENKKFLKLYDAIGADYDTNGVRLNKAMIDMFNKPMWRVEKYVPMNRREQTGAENENRVIEDLMGTIKDGEKWVNRGFTMERIKINPAGQRPIELGLYKTWAQSVNSTEHLLAYGPIVQTLNSVFKGYHAGELRQALKKRWGKAADDRIGKTIAEFANPNPTRQRHALDNIVRMLRGKTATAYLAWKTSGVLRQLMTSPWPYLQEIPPQQYLAACIEVAAGAGKINDIIREKSIYMKNRDFDPMVKLIREAMENNDNAFLSKLDKFNTIGMKGLEWVDWICVAPGWLAVYRKELGNVAKEQEAKYQELLQKYQGSEYADVLPTMESKANRALSETLNEEQQDAEAVARADDAVRRMQPSSRSTDLAPLYKGRTEVFNVFLQFQTALNVIWQNIRYDLPLAVKNKQVLTVVGMVAGYMMAGICLGMLSEIGNDDDDDDEERKLARRILFYSFTQFTDAVPVIGDEVTKQLERLITGKTSYTGQNNFLPVVQKAFGGAGNIAGALWEEDPEKKRKRYIRAVQNMGEAAGIAFGLPVSGAKELGRAAGIGDGDGELDLYWQALLGQRKNK